MERKLKLKRQFDSEYDGGDGDKNSYYDDLKKEVILFPETLQLLFHKTRRLMNRQH